MTFMSVCSQPNEEKGSGSQILSFYESGGTELILRIPAPYSQKGANRMSRISYIDNIEEWASSFQFKHPVKVRFSETDMFGHVNNTVLFMYFEEARVEYFKSIGFMQNWMYEGREKSLLSPIYNVTFLSNCFSMMKSMFMSKRPELEIHLLIFIIWARRKEKCALQVVEQSSKFLRKKENQWRGRRK